MGMGGILMDDEFGEFGWLFVGVGKILQYV
jgi:hypothetical protein